MNNSFSKMSLFGWWLFDFANSIPAVIGGIYFAKWFTEDIGAGSIKLNLLFFISSLLIMLTGKWVGNRIDKNGYKFWIKLSSLTSISTVFLLFAASQIFSKQILVYISFFLFLIFLFGYQIGRICHNVYLRGIVPEHMQNKMSGYGVAANWGGSIVGILITIPIVTTYSGAFGRELTFLVAATGFGLLTPIALFFMFRSTQITNTVISSETINIKTWKTILVSIGFLLLIYLFLFDVMATVQRNLPPFLSVVYKMPDNVQAVGFLIILISALIGGLASAKLVNFNNSVLWLKVSSVSLCTAIILTTLNCQISLWTAFVLAGFSYGILESAIRINFMHNFPPKMAGRSFGVLAVIERTSGIMGPLIWILPFYFFSEEKKANISAMFLMAGLTLVAFSMLLVHRRNLARIVD